MDVDEPLAEELLATRRSRRSTAGNRMQAAMAELALEEVKDEEDADFTNDKDEEDVFDEDFESTASEAEEVTGEGAAQEEEKRARKKTRAHWEKAADAAHARNRATFEPQVQSPPKIKPKRRVVSISIPEKATEEGGHRQSKRKHTVLNRTQTESRLKQSEELRKAAQITKKPRQEARPVTQAELIARALDAEEGNIVEHRDYLKIEEERRRRARVVRQVVEGPLVRWLSRGEDVQTLVPQPTQYYAYTPTTKLAYYPPYSASSSSAPAASTSTLPAVASSTSTSTPYYQTQYYPYTPPPVQRIEKMARNYVVHEETQTHESPPPPGRSNARNQNTTTQKPSWGSTMTAMFGSHVNWEEVQMFSGKGRPLSRPVPMCPMTGLPARYRDPETGVPFANMDAYECLKRVLNHEYTWSSELGAFRHTSPSKARAFSV
ncbi:YL1 nuclear protein-domain-containing protein [Mycena amicta]|nr:YL1 nuclear protein-domain-containing protein [Mycena amicta]